MDNVRMWQLSTGPGDYPWLSGLIDKINTGAPPILKYARGSAVMKLMPAVGDKVSITCRAKLLLKVTIITTFESEYNPHLGIYEEYATVLVGDIVNPPTYMKGQRRNWTLIREG